MCQNERKREEHDSPPKACGPITFPDFRSRLSRGSFLSFLKRFFCGFAYSKPNLQEKLRKAFITSTRDVATYRGGKESKIFCFFFPKKKFLLASPFFT